MLLLIKNLFDCQVCYTVLILHTKWLIYETHIHKFIFINQWEKRNNLLKFISFLIRYVPKGRKRSVKRFS